MFIRFIGGSKDGDILPYLHDVTPYYRVAVLESTPATFIDDGVNPPITKHKTEDYDLLCIYGQYFYVLNSPLYDSEEKILYTLACGYMGTVMKRDLGALLERVISKPIK